MPRHKSEPETSYEAPEAEEQATEEPAPDEAPEAAPEGNPSAVAGRENTGG